MRVVRTDQSHVDDVVEAVDQLATPMEEGVKEQVSSKQAGELLVAAEKLRHWVIEHM